MNYVWLKYHYQSNMYENVNNGYFDESLKNMQYYCF